MTPPKLTLVPGDGPTVTADDAEAIQRTLQRVDTLMIALATANGPKIAGELVAACSAVLAITRMTTVHTSGGAWTVEDCQAAEKQGKALALFWWQQAAGVPPPPGGLG